MAAFLERRCRFDEVVPMAARAVDTAPEVSNPSLDDILDADAQARELSTQWLSSGAHAG